MPKVAKISTNFAGGELSPFLLGRVDTAKYENGVARMENFHPIVQGGAIRRPGSIHVAQAKQACRLIPFVFDRETSYQIEFGAGYLRIWRSSGLRVGTLELATPYTDYSAVRYEQAEDTMFFFHPEHAPRRLQRLSDTSWRLDTMPFVTAPFSEQGFTSAVGLTLSAATVGTGRTIAAASGVFIASDVGRDLESGEGVATITGYTDSQNVTATITTAFGSTSLPSWTLVDSPQAFAYAFQKEPVGSTVQVDSAVPRAAGITLSALTGAITITADAAVFAPGDTGKLLFADSGVVSVTYSSATSLTGTTTTDFLRTTYQAGAWGLTGDAFRAGDVGGHIRMNGGLLEIVSFISGIRVMGKIKVSPTALVAAPPGSWSIEQGSFNATSGYPRCGALHEQRLWLAGSVSQPQTVWASRIGEYLDFEPGLEDADGFGYSLNAHQRNPILHLVAGKRLFPLTTGLEVSLRGGNEKAIGPTNIQKENETTYGTTDVRPVVVGKEVLFVQGGGTAIRAMGYSPAADGFDSPDRTVFAEHVTGPGIVDMAYQARRFPLVYCVRQDGMMAVAAYDIAQEVIAWSRYITQGTYKSVSVVPRPTGDDVWTVVDRPNQAGESVYFLEIFDDSLTTDCASTLLDDSGGPGFSSVSGLDRFEGAEVVVKSDGVSQGLVTVSGGAVTLPRPAHQAEVGLGFLPTIELLPPELGGGGTLQGSNVSVHEVTVRLLDTTTLAINGTESDFRNFGSSLLDRPPPEFTGDYRDITLTDDLYKSRLVITQPSPYKCHVQAVIRKLTANDS